MAGLKILFNPSGKALDPDFINRYSGNSGDTGCLVDDTVISTALRVRNTSWDVVNAPRDMVVSRSGSVQLIFHGEVYNCPELAASLGMERSSLMTIDDGPMIVAEGIERKGMKFVEQINGSFILVVWLSDQKKLYLANDRFGLRPHYYSWRGETFVLSSSVAEVLETRGNAGRLDKVGVFEFFSFEQLLGNRTLVEGISLIPPASICEVNTGRLDVKTYWDFPYPDKFSSESENELCHEMQRRLKVAVDRQLPANCAVGVPLSGGLDSRVLAGIASQSITDLPVFTFGDPGCMDRRLSTQVASRIGAKQFCAAPDSADWKGNFLASVKLCDGMSPVLHAHILMLRKMLSENVGVVLDGFAGDMIVGGYIGREMINAKANPATINQLLSKKYFNRMQNSMVHDVFLDKEIVDCAQQVREELETRAGMCKSDRIADVSDYLAYRERVRRFTINGHTLLRDFVEVRAPFFDYDFIDFSLSLPVKLRFEKRLYKDAIRGMFPALRDIGYTPIGDSLMHSYSKTKALKIMRRPDRLVSSRIPKSIKLAIRSKLKAIRPVTHMSDKGIDYASVFGEDVSVLFSAYSDIAHGWKELTSYEAIGKIISESSADKTMAHASNLSLWLTFQMYREASGVEV